MLLRALGLTPPALWFSRREMAGILRRHERARGYSVPMGRR